MASSKAKIEQELSTVVADYDEVTKELRIADERYQRVQAEIKHTVEILHEEQERVVKIEAIKKSLEIEVKNLSVRLEEVEANAIVGGKRIISKLEARLHDVELELDEEKRRHAETIKILRKKERTLKEVMIQCEEDQKNITILQESLEKASQKVNVFKRQLQEQVSEPNETVRGWYLCNIVLGFFRRACHNRVLPACAASNGNWKLLRTVPIPPRAV